jgi:hypothetical protein
MALRRRGRWAWIVAGCLLGVALATRRRAWHPEESRPSQPAPWETW